MRRVLLTGMSGTGKSSIIDRLVALGYRAIDLDGLAGPHMTRPVTGYCARIGSGRFSMVNRTTCSSRAVARLTRSGFHADFDTIILLSAPREVLVARVATRTRNDYGKRPYELDEILYHVESVEPRLRKSQCTKSTRGRRWTRWPRPLSISRMRNIR